MERFKGTPGPWSVTKYGYEKFSVNGKNMQEVCSTWRASNANLIAAAPDMLEALLAAIECGMVPTSSVKDGGASRHIRQVQVADMIRAAVDKALGEV